MPLSNEISPLDVSVKSGQRGPAFSAEGEGCVVATGLVAAANPEFLAQDIAATGHGPSSKTAVPTEESELSAFLSLVQYDNHYRVDEVLKESPSETTQKVMFVADNGAERGPYVRKYLKFEQGIGSAYKELHYAQENGGHFEHLPQIYALYQLKDDLVVVMEYVQGETLQEVVYRCDPSPELAIEVFPQVCDAVRELHERFNPPIIHRDLKPSNLILSWGKVTLIDFGIARTYRAGGDTDTTRFGTRSYAPPEQFGFGQTDVRSDVYALGMLLFYCLTERAAKQEDRENGFCDSQIPESFRLVIEKACAFDPGNRFASVAELQQAFVNAVALHQSHSSVSFGTAGMPNSSNAQSWFGTHFRQGSVLANTAKGKSFSNRVVGLIQRIPLSIGMVWNVALGLFWLLIAAVCISGCFSPRPDLPEAGYPFWFRVVEYLVFLLPSATCIGYELSDRRLLRRKFYWLKRWPLLAEFLVVAIAVPFVLAVIMTALSQVAGV